MSDTIDGAPSAPSFERIRQVGSAGEEYWFARELAPLLDYQDWRNFVQVVEKAKIACTQSGHEVPDHFGDTTKMVQIGSSAKRPIADFRLSRYACYLIVQNGDPSKPVIANGQTYFALQTRRQELAEASRFRKLSEDGRRLMLRGELTEHNKALTAAAKSAGVKTAMDYALLLPCA
ncbi:DNA-damage-inducible protein (fragment) [Cupriavidus taiwanensis]|uniref:DNA-damage-inducible protein n=1 Tax=Cupriavidus taiwanensis TaxID=164546 RepID=A0A9Q7UX23_9BURK